MAYPLVHVCILTYKRPQLLAIALASLSAQRLVSNPDTVVRVLVVDNDAAASGKAAFEQVFADRPGQAEYIVEEQQGIARARNRALAESSKADFIAFLDDDEIADPFWIDTLLSVQKQFSADAVNGPVAPGFENAPAWIVKGGFFNRKNVRTGTQLPFITTNNLLLTGEVGRKYKFDLRYDRGGGEDTHYALQLRAAGARMIWANDAIVSEAVPSQRATLRWLLRRAHSEANRYSDACLYLRPGLSTAAERLVKAGVGFSAGALMLPAGLIGLQFTVRGLQLICRAAGTVEAVFGNTHSYYHQAS